MASNPASTKESSRAKDVASSAVQPKTLPPNTRGAMSRPLEPSLRLVRVVMGRSPCGEPSTYAASQRPQPPRRRLGEELKARRRVIHRLALTATQGVIHGGLDGLFVGGLG